MALVTAVMIFISCDSNLNGIENGSEAEGLGPVLYNVAFDLDGGDGYIHEQNIPGGGKITPVTNPRMEGYYFCGWKKDNGEAFNITTDKVDGDMTLTAVWKASFKVGDTGPGGGVIFYIADSTKESEYTDSSGNEQKLEWKYLEAAPKDTPDEVEWGKFGRYGTETGIGTGWSNTGKLKTAGIKDFPAAGACVEYSNNGFSDWFLPSRDELLTLYEVSRTNSAVKAVAPDGNSHWDQVIYWTSSEMDGDRDNAWKQYFDYGNSFDGSRYNSDRVRPVRAF